MINTSMRIIAIVSTLVCSILGNSYANHNTNIYQTAYTDSIDIAFERIFNHVRSIPINGTPDNPVYVLTDLSVKDSIIVVLDRQSATFTSYTLDGALLYQEGRPGQGPGELTNPFWIGFDTKGRISILEGSSNYRLQFFSPLRGHSLDIINNIIFPSFWSGAYIEKYENGQKFVFITDVLCSNDNDARRYCLIQEYDISSARLLRTIVPKVKVEPGARSSPWIMGKDKDGYFYIAHNSGDEISIFSPSGSFTRSIDISQIPNYYPMNYSSLPKDDREAFKMMSDMDQSNIRSISIVDGDIILDHMHATDRANDPMFMSIISKGGNHKATTSEVSEYNRKLVKVQGDRFFFLETNRSSDVGSYVVHEYRYEGFEE